MENTMMDALTLGLQTRMDSSTTPLQVPTASDLTFYNAHLAAITTFTVMTTLFVWMRLIIKWHFRTPWLIEDWTCLSAWFAYMTYATTAFAMIPYGFGLHSNELTPHQISNIQMWLYGSSVAYCPATYIIKVTLLLLIARVFSVMEKVQRGIYIFIWALLVAYLPIQLVKMFICTPVSALWDTSIVDPQCMNQHKVFVADLALAILTDFVILILPVPLIWGYSFTTTKKLKIAGLLGAGGVATIVTIYRMYFVVNYIHSIDISYDAAMLNILCFLELSIGLVCACIPTLNLILGGRIRRQEQSNDEMYDHKHYNSDNNRRRRGQQHKMEVLEDDYVTPPRKARTDSPRMAEKVRVDFVKGWTWRKGSEAAVVDRIWGDEMAAANMTSSTLTAVADDAGDFDQMKRKMSTAEGRQGLDVHRLSTIRFGLDTFELQLSNINDYSAATVTSPPANTTTSAPRPQQIIVTQGPAAGLDSLRSPGSYLATPATPSNPYDYDHDDDAEMIRTPTVVASPLASLQWGMVSPGLASPDWSIASPLASPGWDNARMSYGNIVTIANTRAQAVIIKNGSKENIISEEDEKSPSPSP